MKAAAIKHKSGGGRKAQAVVTMGFARSAAERAREIATAAYFGAEARGFAPGRELDDWLEAEARFDAGKGH